jgi:DNA-binding transcriptional regulator LsrR (DeoR family)
VIRRERRPRAAGGEDLEQVRLIVKVAHMYVERGLKQPAIAAQLKISQARVSRLLAQAAEQGIVRTTVQVPPGIFTELEDAIEQRYGLDQVVVVDTGRASDEEVIVALGPSTASFLESVVPGNEVVGISSWSETLLAGVEKMHPVAKSGTRLVVQVLGGFGPAGSQAYVTRLTEGLARACHARPVFLLGPGVVGSAGARQTLLRDPHFAEVVAYYDRLSMVVMGIGSLARPSRLLRETSAVISAETQEELRKLGAVGDVCLRFFDEDGRPVSSSLDARVLGIGVEQLKRTARKVAVAGGARKFTAIRGALRGRWVDSLITDLGVAERLLREP